MATYNNIKKLKIGNDVFNLYDSGNSGGTVTDVQLNGTSITTGTTANVLTTSIANVLYPVGSCYTTSTNSNPSSYLGGTWELIHKGYKWAWISSGFTYNTTNTTNGTFAALLNGNTIEFRFTFKNKVAIKEDTMVIGVLDLKSVGITDGEHGVYVTGYSDSLNAVMIGILDIADGGTNQLQIYDWVTKATSYPTTTGNNCDMSFVINVRPAHMLDSFCDEFVWKRKA